MKLTKYIVGIIFGLSVLSCSEKWDNHYNTQPETVNQNLWDAMQSDAEISLFVKYLKDNRYDTLFATNNTYTIFAPVNAAVTQYIATEQVTKGVLDYLIATHFVQAVNVQGKQKLQTLSEKFALFENIGTHATFDGLDLPFESPLYLNGKYFRMNQMASPRPNLYEFIAQDNPILKRFIDAQDSIILDKEKSRPIGFDENGNTVYDSVSIKVNRFEMKYFPISEEFRNITATLAFPRWDKYEDALEVMAGKLGGIFKTAADIPYEWQKEILIPHLLDHGVFLNMIEVNEFLPKHAKDTAKLQNILGDSVIINYLPANRVICSNGYAYDYSQFTIPDSLYSGKSRLEGEHLVREAGINKFVWRDSVKVNASSSFEPVREFILGASKDSILKVNFPKGYSGTFNVQFNSMRLFPRKYLMVVRTHMDIGGKYNIYINNTLVKTFEYYDYVRGRGIITGVNGTRYTPEGRFNRFDCWVNNITEYGTAKIRFEYTGPNNTPSNGFVVDYIEFVPF